MGAFYSIFFAETEQVISPPESSTLPPATCLRSQREPSETSNQHHLMQLLPSPPQPHETSQVDKINFTVKCAGKSTTIYVFPLEYIYVLLKEACEWARKRPEKMKLIYDGNVLDVNKTVSQYPNLRGGTTVNLIHAG